MIFPPFDLNKNGLVNDLTMELTIPHENLFFLKISPPYKADIFIVQTSPTIGHFSFVKATCQYICGHIFVGMGKLIEWQDSLDRRVHFSYTASHNQAKIFFYR